MLGWNKHKLESRLPREISITSDIRWHHPYGRKWRGTKEPFDENKRGEWKSYLKTQHSKNKDHGIQSHQFGSVQFSHSVVSDSVRPHRPQPTRLCRPWDSPGKNTGVGCHCLLHCVKVKSESEVAQSCPTLSDPMDCSPPGSSIHGILQARVLEWGAIAFSDAI